MKKIIFKSVIFLSSLIIVLVSVIIILSFNTNDESKINTTNSGWQLQTNLQTLLNERAITDMTFIDSLTGFAVSNNKSPGDTGYIFKTTNGGYNWFVNFMPSKRFTRIEFVNDSIGYACGGSGGGTAYYCKTTDRGNTWFSYICGWAANFMGMSILNKDTIFFSDDDGLVGGVFRSTNGGQNWENIYSAGMYNPQDIYMFNGNIGFYTQVNLYKTTNGGYSWTEIDSLGFSDIYFLNSLTGYRAIGYIQKTTNGGNTWTTQTLPIIPGVYTGNLSIQKLFFINQDTIWAAGNYVWYPNPGRYRALINKTTNGGMNWGYQLPDTNLVQTYRYIHVNFYNKNNGWAYMANGKGVYTTTGGDSTIYVGINQNAGNIPVDFILEQSYPNPFNSKSKIKYQINKEVRSQKSEVKLKVFDILGKEIITLVNETKYPGNYEIKFDASNLSSGIYFYSLFIDGYKIDTKKMLLIK
ncbi:MAG TPA: T9SS type A sorting domain-containing protein [Ignavibacteria bacterium]